MSEAQPLYKIFGVGDRFRRSVNIGADYGKPHALDDYIVTSLGRAILARVGRGFSPNATARAWSITGPYGAGKSAAMLFFSEILGYPGNGRARALLESSDRGFLESLYDDIPGLESGGFVVVPLVGTREPIARTLLDGLARVLAGSETGFPELVKQVHELQNLYRHSDNGATVSTAAVAEVIERSVAALRRTNTSVLGLLFVYDELGKALEYAALHPDHSDVGILQEVAELAARSTYAPIGIITVLHQAFEHYAVGLSPAQQREWAKVQGRFEDIGFLGSAGELLELLDKAIYPLTPLDGQLGRAISLEVGRADTVGILPTDTDPRLGQQVLAGCAPLHPTVALSLSRLFRSSLSQNERSLFAFLSSGEPNGFQEFLRQETWSEGDELPFYRLDRLYDYVLAAMGSALYIQAQGKKWAEIEDALDRLPRTADEVDHRLVKTIGLLGLLGDQRYLKASENVLAVACAAEAHGATAQIREALERLESGGIIVYRRFNDTYSLWQGSDVDLNERFEHGLAHADKSTSLATLLRDRGQLKPYVAKRHLHETGTFRYFVPQIVDLADLPEFSEQALEPADGAVVFVVETHSMQKDDVVARVKAVSQALDSTRRKQVFFAVPKALEGIREAVDAVLAWEWVARNTPELEGDRIARRELAARHLAAQERLERTTARCFHTAHSFRSCTWIHAGSEQHFPSARDLAASLSAACDRVYRNAPIVKNELINRRKLSSAAAAARRNLIERMLGHSTEARLGMEGYPPEMSIYLSVLEQSGLHQRVGNSWAFGPAQGEDRCRVSPLWQAIDDFLTATEKQPCPVSDLYHLIRQPPYGVNDGLLPIYMTAALLHWESEVACYEDGSFVPEIGIAVLERLLRVPQRFAVQRYALGGARSYLFDRYSRLLGGAQQGQDHASLLSAIRPILAFINHQPPYTLLTQALSPEAIAVRDALLSAKEPQRLLFEDLPTAVGMDPRPVSAEREAAKRFFVSLRNSLLELERAYDTLLTTVQEQLVDALRLPQAMTAARQEAAQRAMVLQEYVADLKLQAFLQRLADNSLPDREWIESVASCLASKPPKRWTDHDALLFQTELAQEAGRFRRMEEIAFEANKIDEHVVGVSLIRLSVTDQSGDEARDIVAVRPEEESDVRAVADELVAALHQRATSTRIGMAAIAELARRFLAPSQQQEKDPK